MNTNGKLKYLFAAMLGGVLGSASIIIFQVISPAPSSVTDERVAQIAREELKRLINEDPIFESAIDKGIIDFVKKQQNAANSEKNRQMAEQSKKIRPVSKDTDHIYGDVNAPLTLVEYSDYECPFCKRFHPTAKKFVDQSNGQVNWVYRHFPLDFHNPVAQNEAEAAECAASQGGNNEFWLYSELIYQNTKSNGDGLSQSQLIALAKQRGLKTDVFKQCLESGKMKERVNDDFLNGTASGVTGTPGNFLLNNRTGKITVLAGAVPLSQLSSSAKALLAE